MRIYIQKKNYCGKRGYVKFLLCHAPPPPHHTHTHKHKHMLGKMPTAKCKNPSAESDDLQFYIVKIVKQ